jgi:PAS domain S-box-containing protein
MTEIVTDLFTELRHKEAGVVQAAVSYSSDSNHFEIGYINTEARRILRLSEDKAYVTGSENPLSDPFYSELNDHWAKTESKLLDSSVQDVLRVGSNDQTSTFIIQSAKTDSGILSVLFDIAPEREPELASKKTSDSHHSVLNYIKDVYYRTDLDGTILDVSESVRHYTGFERTELIGTSVFQFYASKDVRELFLRKLLEKGTVHGFESRFVTKSNRHFYASNNAHLIRDTKGRPIGIEGILRDITEKKEAEKKLKEINEKLIKLNTQKDKLFSAISHDLKNALSGPVGLYELILDDFDNLSREDLRNYMTELDKSTENAMDLLLDLLEWSKNQFTGIVADKKKLNLYSVAKKSCAGLENKAEKKSISLKNLISPELDVYADEIMLNSVFRNLLINAIKFSHEGTGIDIEAESGEDGFVKVSVRDYGIGMDSYTLGIIFNRSIQFTRNGTDGEKGSGLGLDLCVDFIDKLGGTIRAESKEGEGTVFYFTLPEAR